MTLYHGKTNPHLHQWHGALADEQGEGMVLGESCAELHEHRIPLFPMGSPHDPISKRLSTFQGSLAQY